jgi:type II secretory pathway component PulC
VAVFVLRPLIFGGGAKPTAAAKARKGAASDTGAAATKTAKARGKAKAARGKAAQEAEVQPEVKVAEAPAVFDTTPPQWGDDPFVRDWLMAGELRDMKLRAVTIGEKSLALINDRIVAKGDTINGKRVAEITRDSVVFEFGGQRRGLKIGE